MKKTLGLAVLMLGGMGVAALSVPDAATAQEGSQEVYHLVQLGGADLPAVIDRDDECHDELHAATLTLEPGGRWELQMTEHEVCGNSSEEDQDNEDGRYEVDGNTIRFFDDDGDPPTPDDDLDIDVDELHTGTRTDQGLVIVLSDGQTELMFHRAGSAAAGM